MAVTGMGLFRRVPPLVTAVTVAVLLAACGAGPPAGHPQRSTTQAASTLASPSDRASDQASDHASVRPSPGATPSPAGPPSVAPVAPGEGARPQTRAFPSTRSAAFRNAMADLWLAVTTGDARLALAAFFPLTAYEQVKAIPDPAADWHGRLWYDFALDVGAAHHLAGSDARLVRVVVPVSDAAWIYPGGCANSLGYWHVPGARVVYSERGQERSFGIASLISWRGVWYVVHFGAVLRSVVTGVVDQPAAGPGTPGPPGGC
jgi:hypothetical protein